MTARKALREDAQDEDLGEDEDEEAVRARGDDDALEEDEEGDGDDASLLSRQAGDVQTAQVARAPRVAVSPLIAAQPPFQPASTPFSRDAARFLHWSSRGVQRPASVFESKARVLRYKSGRELRFRVEREEKKSRILERDDGGLTPRYE